MTFAPTARSADDHFCPWSVRPNGLRFIAQRPSLLVKYSLDDNQWKRCVLRSDVLVCRPRDREVRGGGCLLGLFLNAFSLIESLRSLWLSALAYAFSFPLLSSCLAPIVCFFMHLTCFSDFNISFFLSLHQFASFFLVTHRCRRVFTYRCFVAFLPRSM